MSPRRSAADARATRASIVDTAVELASVEGLDGLSIGRLASELRMSKSGVIGHFGSKEALQLVALEQANQVFREQVWEPHARLEPGLPRLRALAESWMEWLVSGAFAGGCFITAASTEFDGRPGPVRDAVVASVELWERTLAHDARIARETGQLRRDPDQVVFEISAIAVGLNQAVQLRADEQAHARALHAVRRTLALSPSAG